MRQVMSIAAVLLLLATGFSTAAVTAQEPSLRDLLPSAAEIGPGFVVVADRPRTLSEQAAMFGNPDDAARRLAEWGWENNAFIVFQATELTAGGAPAATVDISLTRFASAADAAAAMPFFLEDRAAVLGQRELQTVARVALGDLTRFVVGDVPGGYDMTYYVRSGPLLLRVSATSASGDGAATPDPEAIARGIIERFAGHAGPVSVGVVQPAEEALLPPLAAFETLPLDNAACFRVTGEGDLELPAVAERLAAGEDVADTLDELGWAAGVYRQFACDPEPGRAGWIDLSVHRFPDAAAAADAVAVFAEIRAQGMDLQPAPLTALGEGDAAITGPAVNGTEYTRYVSRGPLLFAVTGVAPVGDPRADVDEVVAALVALPLTESAPQAITPTSTPYTLGEAAPTVAPSPTATAIPPTPMPPPTAPTVPTATAIPPTPVPTATPLPTAPPPTATPVPTQASALIEVTVPPQPQPTATSGPLPTATPRVIHLPTPDGG